MHQIITITDKETRATLEVETDLEFIADLMTLLEHTHITRTFEDGAYTIEEEMETTEKVLIDENISDQLLHFFYANISQALDAITDDGDSVPRVRIFEDNGDYEMTTITKFSTLTNLDKTKAILDYDEGIFGDPIEAQLMSLSYAQYALDEIHMGNVWTEEDVNSILVATGIYTRVHRVFLSADNPQEVDVITEMSSVIWER